MILFAWGSKREEVPAWDNAPLRTWRWTFQLGWPWVGFVQQLMSASDDGFRDGSGLAIVWATYRFRVGAAHMYYDGPNCALYLGFLHVFWTHRDCKKCWDLGHDEC